MRRNCPRQHKIISGMDPATRPVIGRLSVFALALTLVAGCSLPEPDGTEAALAARAAELAPLAPAQGPGSETTVRNGLLLSPQVREAASKISASADEVRVQRAAIFPSIGLSLGGGVGDAGKGDTAIDLTGRQLLLGFGQTKRAVTSADLDLQINYVTFQQTVDAAISDVLESYTAVRKYGLLLEVRKKQLAAMRELQALVSERTDIGAATSTDILETRKRLHSAEFLVHDTELTLAEARDRLNQLSGQTRGGSIPALSGALCSSGDNSDELRKKRLELVKAQIDLKSAERARQPRAYLEPIARHTLGEGGISPGLNVGINSDLLQGGALTARANVARNNLQGVMAEVDATRRNDVLEVGRLKREIAAAGSKSTMLERQIELLVETRGLYRSQYFDLGTREISDLLDNEEEFYNRKAELIELEADLTGNRIECAIRDRSLRKVMKVDSSSLYGYPLTPDAI